jgi:hypothetical protein
MAALAARLQNRFDFFMESDFGRAGESHARHSGDDRQAQAGVHVINLSECGAGWQPAADCQSAWRSFEEPSAGATCRGITGDALAAIVNVYWYSELRRRRYTTAPTASPQRELSGLFADVRPIHNQPVVDSASR